MSVEFRVDGIPCRRNSVSTEFRVDGIPCRRNSVSMEFRFDGGIPCRPNSVDTQVYILLKNFKKCLDCEYLLFLFFKNALAD